MYKTTKKGFRFFRERCEHWKNKLSVTRWEFEYSHEELDSPFVWSNCTYDTENRAVKIRLNTEWNVEPTEKALETAALEEVAHVLLGRLAIMGEWRYVRPDEFTEEVHAIIRSLQNVLLG